MNKKESAISKLLDITSMSNELILWIDKSIKEDTELYGFLMGLKEDCPEDIDKMITFAFKAGYLCSKYNVFGEGK